MPLCPPHPMSHCRPSCRTHNCLHSTTPGLQSTWREMTRREVTLSGPQLGLPSPADPSLQKFQLLGIWLLHPFPVFWPCFQSQQLLFQFKQKPPMPCAISSPLPIHLYPGTWGLCPFCHLLNWVSPTRPPSAPRPGHLVLPVTSSFASPRFGGSVSGYS